MQFVTVVPEDDVAALEAAAEEVREREEAWWSQAYKLVDEAHFAPAGAAERQARREAMEELRTRRETARREGRLLGSRSRLIAWHLARVLAEMGWDAKQWPPLPAGQHRPGRRWGSKNRPREQRGVRIAIELPDELGDQLRRACYWHSLPATEKLQEWADRFGPGPAELEATGHYGLAVLLTALQGISGRGPRGDDLSEREALRAQIITTADVLRAAIDEAINATPPEPPPL